MSRISQFNCFANSSQIYIYWIYCNPSSKMRKLSRYHRIHEFCISGGYTVPAGVHAAIHIHCIHRNPKYYEKADEFYPPHFTPERSSTRHPFAFIPFSAGPRNCIGNHKYFYGCFIWKHQILTSTTFSRSKICNFRRKTVTLIIDSKIQISIFARIWECIRDTSLGFTSRKWNKNQNFQTSDVVVEYKIVPIICRQNLTVTISQFSIFMCFSCFCFDTQ